MECAEKIQQNKTVLWLRQFFDGKFFPVIVGIVALVLYVLRLPILSIAVFAILVSVVLLFAEDTRPAVPVLMMVIITFHYKDDPQAYLTVPAFITYAVLAPLLVYSFIYRLIKYRVEWKKRRGLLSMALFSLAFLVGGIFTRYYGFMDIGYAFSVVATSFGCYAFFAWTMKKREDNLLYFARVCAIMICVISAEILELYLRQYEWGRPLDSGWKDEIILGWSICNMVAEIVAFLLPAVFYLIFREKNGWLYWFVVLIAVIGIYFTFCRNALLWAGLTCIVGFIINCITGENKKVNRYLLIIGGIVGISGIIYLYCIGYLDNILLFFKNAKLNNRGRFTIWNWHIEKFTETPLVGFGFQQYAKIPEVTVRFAHNNLIQMLCSTGVIGLVLYLIHRVWTVYNVLKDPTPDRLFIGGCILVLLGISLMSPTFFLPYCMMYYAIILIFLEKSAKE